MASEATLFGIRRGNRGTFLLTMPGLDPNRFWFKIRDVDNAEDRESLKTAGLSWEKQGRSLIMRVNAWEGFVAKAEAQIVDYRYPQFDRDGVTIKGEHRFYRNPMSNLAVYREFSDAQIEFLTAAMDQVAGRELTPETQELWERLENEYGPLLTPMSDVGE